MTTEEFHAKLRNELFYKIGTGGGCEALVAYRYMEPPSRIGETEIMLTAAEDPSLPEADEQVQITIRIKDGLAASHEVTWITSPEETLAFAKSVSVWPNHNK
jgi:hypothetical protein